MKEYERKDFGYTHYSEKTGHKLRGEYLKEIEMAHRRAIWIKWLAKAQGNYRSGTPRGRRT